MKMAVSGIVLLAVVLTMALVIKGGEFLEMAAITGAIVSVLTTGCLTEKWLKACIDWLTIFVCRHDAPYPLL